MEEIIKNEMSSMEDLDILTFSDEDELLRNLLFTWGLSKLYDDFFNAGVTLEELRHINLDELKDLIPKERIGDRFRLRRNLEKWRIQQGYEPFYFDGPSSSDNQRRMSQAQRRPVMTLAAPPPPPREQQELLKELFTVSRATPELNNTAISETQNREIFPLDQLLQSNPKGQSIIDYYRQHDTLDDLRKKLLVDCIVSHYTNLVQRMASSDVDYYAEAIIKLFPNEDKDYYYVPRVGRKNARGKLYDKAGNVAHRLRVNGLIKSKFIRRAPVEATTEVTSTNITEMSEAESESMNWLKHHIKPLSEVEHHWMITQEIRAKDMKYYTNPIALFAQWPHYRQTFGSSLIDLDFKFLYPDSENMLFDKWALFAEKSLPYYRQHIKDKRTLHILSKLSDDTDPNSTHCMLVLAIHAILKPVRISIKVSESKSQICQYSIMDSQGTFIIQGDCREEIEEKLEILRESTMMRSSPDILPLLAVVGEDYDELKEFYVVYDGIFYKFQTFLKALDVCFKLYHVLNISYPKQCIVVWTFIQIYFYDIQRQDDEKNPNVCNFISHLK